MFFKRNNHNRGVKNLPDIQDIPELVGRYLVVTKKRDPDWVWKLKAVVRKNQNRGGKVFDCRVFDDAQLKQKDVKIEDWTTFDDHPELILYEGWYDKATSRAMVEEKKMA